MNHLIKTSLFTLGLILSSNAFAATGTGHAQTELETPLTVEQQTAVNFGTIAIDPSAGGQTVSIQEGEPASIVCPATYVCSGTPDLGLILVSGMPDTAISADMTGSTATLSDGTGNTLTFDPSFHNSTDQYNTALGPAGTMNATIIGSITFTGNEVAGTYSSNNAGGTGYQINVNY